MGKQWKSIITVAVVSLLASPCHADGSWFDEDTAEHAQTPARSTTKSNKSIQPDMHQLSEAFGHFIGRDISKMGLHFDVNAVVKGIREGVAGKPAPMDEEEYEAVITQFRERHFQEVANFNLALADAFMKSNAKRPGIVQAEPGTVQYVVLQPGRGVEITPRSNPQLIFTGRFIDGTVFTEPSKGNKATAVALDDMIPGFQKGVIGMREGEKRRIFVHPQVAYGTTGDFAPNSLLLFEVEAVKASPPSNSYRPANKGQTALNTPSSKPTRDTSWDLTLDLDENNAETQNDDDDFSSQRIVLQPVTSQKPTSAQNRGNRNRW